jgi:Rrf2 family protein
MLQITTQARYALRLMLDLAQNQSETPVARTDIALRQEISSDYLAQLCRKLINAGLIEGIKGPHGGYRLSHNPAQISVGDVIRAVDGPIRLVHCINSDDKTPCNRKNTCVASRLWEQASKDFNHYFDRFLLSELTFPLSSDKE